MSTSTAPPDYDCVLAAICSTIDTHTFFYWEVDKVLLYLVSGYGFRNKDQRAGTTALGIVMKARLNSFLKEQGDSNNSPLNPKTLNPSDRMAV